MLWPFPTPPNPHLLGLLALKTVWKLNCTLKIIVMGGKWKHISIFFTWGSATSHDSRSFPGTMSGWLDFRVAPTYHSDNSQKNRGFLTLECSSKLSKRLPCRQLQLNCALVNSPWCPFFFFLESHMSLSIFILTLSEPSSVLKNRMGAGVAGVLVKINHNFWQASVTLTHLGTRILPCKTVQPSLSA